VSKSNEESRSKKHTLSLANMFGSLLDGSINSAGATANPYLEGEPGGAAEVQLAAKHE
jgi:hypothetical protein